MASETRVPKTPKRSKKLRVMVRVMTATDGPTGQVVAHCILILLGYLFLLTFMSRVLTNFDLLDAVSVCKIGSLCALIYVNGAILKEMTGSNNFDRTINGILILTAVVVIIISFLKIMEVHFEPTSKISEILASALNWPVANASYISAVPVIGYAWLDFTIMRRKPSRKGRYPTDSRDSRIARKFFTHVDLVCCIPIVWVFSIPYLFNVQYTSEALQLFTNGAMAVVILAHSISTHAVKVYNE